MSDSCGPILYVIVVGFHHKKGCQVEYSFPALVPDAPNECPPGWKYLPTLALPDGSHNYDEDTAYFHLPSLDDPKKTVFGVSCYRQIPVEKIKNRTADITRGSVQKAVCILSKVPLYGYIQVKITLITHAYFEEGDFTKVSLLEDTYHHLNAVLMQNDLATQTFVGLSARDFILHWKHKALLLFKLLLLEKRIIFFRSPVQSLCSTILTLISLHPLMIEQGLEQSACVKLSRPMSPMPDFSDEDSPCTSPGRDSKRNLNNIPLTNKPVPSPIDNDSCCIKEDLNVKNARTDVDLSTLKLEEASLDSHSDNVNSIEIEDSKLQTEVGIELTESNDFGEDGESIQNNLNLLAHTSVEACGVPLPLFARGYLCLPYLSLPYLDLLADVKVRGYVVGATNVLFKQKRQLHDVLIDIENGKIECQDVELRKQLHLTTEDLRFADYIVKHVAEERHDIFLDGVGWEGGDEWIRTQFRIYLLYLLKTSLLTSGNRELEYFNSSFMAAWKETHNYKMWQSRTYPGMQNIPSGHPFAGQLSVSDMKLRFAHTMQNTEGGRKLNQAMASTGRVVATTSKAVGGAFSHAKGAFSNWWSNLVISPDMQKGIEAIETVEDENDGIPEALLTNGDVVCDRQDDNSSVHKPGEVHTV